MKIFDNNNNLLAEIVKSESIEIGKNFYTDENQEFQFASFNFDKETEIKRHIHNRQERTIYSTSEVIVVIEGSINVQIYDSNLALQCECELVAGDSVAFYSGGHGLQILSNAKFLEVKQGPYNSVEDKKLF